MLKGINAIIWKEFRSIKNKYKGLMFSLSISSLMFFTVTLIRIFTLKNSLRSDIFASQQISIYVSGLISYMALIYTLRFWEEKSTRTIDSLFATPLSVRQIMVGKVLASVAFSIGVSLTSLLLFSLFFALFSSTNILSIQTILITISIPILFNIPYGIVNGYTMWCLKTGMAKIVQLISFGIFFGSFASIWSGINATGISSTLVYSFMTGAIFLWILSIYCLIFANKEKTLLNMPE